MKRTVPPSALSLSAAAREVPRRTALVSSAGSRTFAELWEEVEPLASSLEQELSGMTWRGAPARVALVATPTVDVLRQLFALFELGEPVLLLHPRWTEAEQSRFLTAYPGVMVLERGELPGDRSSPVQRAESVADDRCLAIVTTSGTAGRPKGVVLSRRAVVASAVASAARLGWREDDRWLLALTPAHVGGLSIVTRCLAARRAVVLALHQRFAPETFVAAVRRHRTTLLSLVPTMLHRLVAAGIAAPPCVRVALVGGAPTSPAIVAEARALGWPVRLTYGLSEACSQVATQTAATATSGTAGCEPLDGVDVRVRDGRVEVRGPTLFSGYWPALGEASATPAEAWLDTGDVGRLDAEGRLHVLGRRDEMIVSGGENVAPREVETVLESHPDVAEACVLGVADAEWGEIVAALVVATKTEESSDSARRELEAWCRRRLAPFKRPRRWLWVAELPRNAIGKLDRRAAAAQWRPARRRTALRPDASSAVSDHPDDRGSGEAAPDRRNRDSGPA